MLFTNKSAVGKCDGKWSYTRAKKLNSIRAWSERKKEKHERISCSAKGNVCKNFDYFQTTLKCIFNFLCNIDVFKTYERAYIVAYLYNGLCCIF